MDLFEAIKHRRSVRSFTEEPVNEVDLKLILDAANWAPSARNQQPWRFIVIKDKKILFNMADAVNKKLDIIEKKAQEDKNDKLLKKSSRYRGPFTFFKSAPLTIAVVMAEYEGTGLAAKVGVDASKFSSSLQSVSAAIQNFLLATHALGYGSCWMTGPLIAEPEISDILKVKKEEQLVALLPLGKYSLPPKAKPRKTVEQVTTFIE